MNPLIIIGGLVIGAVVFANMYKPTAAELREKEEEYIRAIEEFGISRWAWR